MIAVRKYAWRLNDLPLSTLASPNNVSGMIDFGAKIFASSSTFLAYFISNSAGVGKPVCTRPRIEVTDDSLPGLES